MDLLDDATQGTAYARGTVTLAGRLTELDMHDTPRHAQLQGCQPREAYRE